ncbi:hypothetical protein GTP46_07400 [Duganella sp. FT135W]|uniref:Uncharacterized protein n=1 Tax=Duganella flavida TaxID=2692175 RepID=A0A6L8K7F0_9BURK|nr:hypothetical protein [Duganella flavida]MYM22467.1 hypothetical protein [Duganella flavida]
MLMVLPPFLPRFFNAMNPDDYLSEIAEMQQAHGADIVPAYTNRATHPLRMSQSCKKDSVTLSVKIGHEGKRTLGMAREGKQWMVSVGVSYTVLFHSNQNSFFKANLVANHCVSAVC